MNKEYRIPLKCPFTGTIIFDNNGYHEPFPETLICYYIDRMEYLLPGLEVIEDIIITLDNIKSHYKNEHGKVFKNIIKSFPWINKGFKSVESNSMISAHSLVKREVDQNYYISMNSGVYSFYFALSSNHKTILHNYKKVYEELLIIEEKLKNE